MAHIRNIDELKTQQTPLIIRNIVVTTDNNADYCGEFKEPTLGKTSLADAKKIYTQVQRLYAQIEKFIEFSSKIHSKNNCHLDGSLQDSKLNNITRLITSEFFFYTQEPLSFSEFNLLQNKIAKLAERQTLNLHLALGSFAVRTPTDEIMNVVAYVECGPQPKFHFLVKNNPSTVDPLYKDIDGDDINPLRYIDKSDDISSYYLLIQGKQHFFTFDTVFLSHSAGGIAFYNCTDICLDHIYGSAKNNLDKKLLESINIAEENTEIEPFPVYSSHMLISKTIGKIPKNSLGRVTQADPKQSQHNGKIDTTAETELNPPLFGNPIKVVKLKPIIVTIQAHKTRPAYLAIQHGKLNVWRNYFQQNISSNSVVIGTKSKSLLMTAAKYDQEDIAVSLLNRNAHVNDTDNRQRVALHFAAQRNHTNIIRLLVSFCANLNLQMNDGKTPLHLAAENGNNEAVILLLIYGANPNIQDKKGQTPLHLAATQNELKTIKLLIEADAKLDIKDSKNRTPAMLASQKEAKKILNHTSSNAICTVSTKSVTSNIQPETKKAKPSNPSMCASQQIIEQFLDSEIILIQQLNHLITILKSAISEIIIGEPRTFVEQMKKLTDLLDKDSELLEDRIQYCIQALHDAVTDIKISASDDFYQHFNLAITTCEDLNIPLKFEVKLQNSIRYLKTN